MTEPYLRVRVAGPDMARRRRVALSRAEGRSCPGIPARKSFYSGSRAGVCALSKHFAGFARCSASNTLPVLTLRVAISQNFMDSLHDECEQLFRVCLDHTHYDACAAGPHAKLNSVVDLVCEHVVRFCLRPTCRQACSIRAI
eukprot:1650921-Rhodomonas_salina.4